jgi:hypothetical protein
VKEREKREKESERKEKVSYTRNVGVSLGLLERSW